MKKIVMFDDLTGHLALDPRRQRTAWWRLACWVCCHLPRLGRMMLRKNIAFLTDSEFLSSVQGHVYLKASHFTEIQEYKNLFSQLTIGIQFAATFYSVLLRRRILYFLLQCGFSGSRFRCFFDPWIREENSGSYFWELIISFLS